MSSGPCEKYNKMHPYGCQNPIPLLVLLGPINRSLMNTDELMHFFKQGLSGGTSAEIENTKEPPGSQLTCLWPGLSSPLWYLYYYVYVLYMSVGCRYTICSIPSSTNYPEIGSLSCLLVYSTGSLGHVAGRPFLRFWSIYKMYKVICTRSLTNHTTKLCKSSNFFNIS